MDSSFYTAKGSFTGTGLGSGGVGAWAALRKGSSNPSCPLKSSEWSPPGYGPISTGSQCLIGYLPKPPTPLLGFLVAPQRRLALLQRLGTHCPPHTRPIGGARPRVAQCLPRCSHSHAEAIGALSASTNRNWFHRFPPNKYDPIRQQITLHSSKWLRPLGWLLSG